MVNGMLQMYVVPVKPVAMVEYVVRALDGPAFKSRVTGPVASYQVMLKFCPTVTPLNVDAVLPILAAWATAKAAAAKMAVENCMLRLMGGGLLIGIR